MDRKEKERWGYGQVAMREACGGGAAMTERELAQLQYLNTEIEIYEQNGRETGRTESRDQ